MTMTPDIDTGLLFVASTQTVRPLPPNFTPGWKYSGWPAPTNNTRDRHNEIVLPRRKRSKMQQEDERSEIAEVNEMTSVVESSSIPAELRPVWMEAYHYLTPESNHSASELISTGDRYTCKCGQGFDTFIHYYKCRRQHG